MKLALMIKGCFLLLLFCHNTGVLELYDLAFKKKQSSSALVTSFALPLGMKK